MYNCLGDFMKESYNIIVLKNQGFCYGVTRAIEQTDQIMSSLPKPVHLLGPLVHNKFVSDYFKAKGIIILTGQNRLEMLAKINTGSVIITAHGASPLVYKTIAQKQLSLFDATCPHVTLSMKKIKEYLDLGYDIIYIGKQNHPETEAALGLGKKIHLIETIDDIANLEISNSLIALSNQTTMSIFDIETIIESLKLKFPQIVILKTICNATKNRQKELSDTIVSLAGEKVLVVIVGDNTSNNTLMLQKRADSFKNASTIKIESKDELSLNFVKQYPNIIVASGASTPLKIVNDVIDKLTTLNK